MILASGVVANMPKIAVSSASVHSKRQVFCKARRTSAPKFIEDAKKVVCTVVAGSFAALSLQMSAPNAQAEFVQIPLSSDLEIQRQQTKMLETWSIASDLFYDSSIDDDAWTGFLVNGLSDQMVAESQEEAGRAVDNFLAQLNDPYTRIEPSDQFAAFRAASDGELQGVGLVISSDSGKVVVLAPVKGGPAERAGIKPGDEVIRIDGKPVQGMTGEQAAQYLRGQVGSSVTLTIQRYSGEPEMQATVPSGQFRDVLLQRERVHLSPVQWTILNQGGDNVGYIKLMSFSQQAGNDMALAISSLKSMGAQAFILDLRNNPGGLVNSALEVAQQWLGPDSPVVNVLDSKLMPDNNPLGDTPNAFQEALNLAEAIVIPSIPGHLPAHQISVRNGGTTAEPLVVLVNKGSASAAEILAGALQDNNRAVVVGDTNTYGKGKIQGVFPLSDGSGLFLTVAKYETPNFHEIDLLGVHPDHSCGVRPVVVPQSFVDGQPGRVLNGSFETVVDLDNDPCVTSAEADLHKLLQKQGLVPAPRTVADVRKR